MRRNNIPGSYISISLTVITLLALLPSVLGSRPPSAEPEGIVYALLNKAEKSVPIDLQINGTKMTGTLQIIAHSGMQVLISVQGTYPPSAFEAAGINNIPISFSATPAPPATTIAPWLKINTPSIMNIVNGENAYGALTIRVGNITEDWQYTEFMLQARYVDPMSGENTTNSMTITVTTHIEEDDHHLIPQKNKASTNTTSTTATPMATITTTATASENISKLLAIENGEARSKLNLIAVATTVIGAFILLLLFALRRRMIV